jgi:hypothetical protein
MLIFPSLLIFVAFVAFPESKDAILQREKSENIRIDSSGSLGLFQNGKCHITNGSETLTSDEYKDWCSNIATNKDDPKLNPFIQYSIKGKQMKVTRYSVRNGCCRYYTWCCHEEDGKIIDYDCCCSLNSYSMQASNDNKTWTVLHRVENDKTMFYCTSKTFDIEQNAASKAYTYFRFVLEKEHPGCPKCMQINQLELYGETISSGFIPDSENADDDESISIIGRIQKNEY